MTDLIYATIPAHRMHHKNNRIGKKWRKKYMKVQAIYTNVMPINAPTNCDECNSHEITFKGSLSKTPELEKMAEKIGFRFKLPRFM
jgi:hypothetical protein